MTDANRSNEAPGQDKEGSAPMRKYFQGAHTQVMTPQRFRILKTISTE